VSADEGNTAVSPRSLLALATGGLVAVAIGAVITTSSASTPDSPARPGPVLHLPTTIHLVAKSGPGSAIDSTHVLLDEVLTKPGTTRLVGTEALSCTVSGNASAPSTCDGGLALRDGALLIEETLYPSSRTLSGKVLGGSGSYAGASGTITGRGRGGGKSTLTINYTLG
jgi:hypothetical protein